MINETYIKAQVTVLMPIYNAERFLHDSIGSLLNQTCGNWKLICIDDGSTDSSKAIVEEYCKKDSRISLICQENAGPAVARARAIEIADTEYVSILDSDDAYAPDYIEKMLARAEETGTDSIVPDVEFGFGNTKKLPNMFVQHHLSADMIIDDGKKAFAMTIPWQLHGWQMVRTSLAKKYYTIQQASYSKFNSDEYITRLLYLKSKKVALCSAIYKYRIDETSITRKPSLKMMDYLVTNAKLLWLAEYEKVADSTIVNIYNAFYSTCKNLKLNLLGQLKPANKEEANRLLKDSIINFKDGFKWKYLKRAPIRTKLKFFMFLLPIRKSFGNVVRSAFYSSMKKFRKIRIRNKNVTIISNNCWGGFMYQSCKLKYNSPFIGLYMYAPEYIALLRNLKYNLTQSLHFIKHEQSKYKDIVPPQYILGVLGDTGIEIVFMHNHLEEEALEKWNRRLKRINWDNMIVKFSDTDYGCTDELIEEFGKMPFKHKVCFTAKEHPDCSSVIYMPEYKDKPYVLFEWAYSYRYYNFVQEANKILK